MQKHLKPKKYGNTSLPLYDAAIVCLNKSLKFSTKQCDLSLMRETCYLLARLYNEVSLNTKRDETAQLFIKIEEDALINMKHTLGYVCRFDIRTLINSEIEEIKNFQKKYNCRL